MVGGDEIPKMTDARARQIEDELYSLQRQQKERNHPLPMPRPEFWLEVNSLLNHIEGKLNDIIKKEGHSTNAITASKRQANVRRSMADLARKRLVTLLHHSVTTDLRSSKKSGEGMTPLAPLDWARFDPYEREFYDGLSALVSKFKLNVGWDEMTQGIGESNTIPVVPVGTKQLDDFVEEPGGLTGQGPPPIELEEQFTDDFKEPDLDEEDRIASIEAYPEMMEQANEPVVEKTQPVLVTEEISAWDLAPSTDSKIQISLENLQQDGQIEEDDLEEEVEKIPNVLTRIRILVSQDDEIITADGEELKLSEGDIHMLDAEMAEYLVDSGVAEMANL